MAALGDTLYRGAAAWKRLVGNTTTAKQYLSQTGTGAVSAAPAWAQVADADLSVTNVTTNNVSTAAHGFAPIAPNDVKKFLRGDATWAAPVHSYAEVALASGDILALRGTPFELVAAPGAGKVLEFCGGILILDATATAYVESAANLGIKYTNGSGVQVSETIEATGFIDQTADTLTTMRPKLDAIVAKSGCENKALVLHNLGAGEYTTGTGALRVKIAYRTWTTGW